VVHICVNYRKQADTQSDSETSFCLQQLPPPCWRYAMLLHCDTCKLLCMDGRNIRLTQFSNFRILIHFLLTISIGLPPTWRFGMVDWRCRTSCVPVFCRQFRVVIQLHFVTIELLRAHFAYTIRLLYEPTNIKFTLVCDVKRLMLHWCRYFGVGHRIICRLCTRSLKTVTVAAKDGVVCDACTGWPKK